MTLTKCKPTNYKMCFENTSIMGFDGAIRGMRNSYENYANADSGYCLDLDTARTCETCPNEAACVKYDHDFVVGPHDLELAKKLIAEGAPNRKFLRMIHVQVDVYMPRYWWAEADTYKFGVKNSTSTMHKLLNRKTPIDANMIFISEEDADVLQVVVDRLEEIRKLYEATTDNKERKALVARAKRILPEGFIQMRTWDTNYEELRKMYHERKDHALTLEWGGFCRWVETLPYAEDLLTT
ncbi:MAG TPA: hypothetical protein PLT28_00285 [Saprospiraceae bacterium]|nr:hypothetical protein [Saprospiraceae bacterium]